MIMNAGGIGGGTIRANLIVNTSPTKTTYTEGESIDLTGCVVTWSGNDFSVDVTNLCTFSPTSGNDAYKDMTEIVVTYITGGVTYTTSIPITVTLPVLNSTFDCSEANTLLVQFKNGSINSSWYKAYDGLAYVAWIRLKQEGNVTPLLVSKTESAVAFYANTNDIRGYKGTITYGGETYYYSYDTGLDADSARKANGVANYIGQFSGASSIGDAATFLLDLVNGKATVASRFECSDANTLLCTLTDRGYLKVYSGFAYVAYYTMSDGYTCPLLVSEEESAVAYLTCSETFNALGSFSRNGKTWYYSNSEYAIRDARNWKGVAEFIGGSFASAEEAANCLLDIIDLDNYIPKNNNIPKNLEIVSFSSGTDAQIKAMLDAYYANEITWNDMGWAVGNTRKIHLNAMTAPNPNSSNTWAAQDIILIIVDHDKTKLATPINGHNNACITVQCREVLNNCTASYDDAGHIYANGDSAYDTTFTKWSNLYMRTYLNNTVLDAIPSGDFKSSIKASKHYRLTTNGNNPMTANTTDGSKTVRTTEEVTDTLFLPSYSEIYGNTQFDRYLGGGTPNSEEGTQFAYYQTASNRIKNGNNNGSPSGTVCYWWMGSASSYYDSSYEYRWCRVNPDGSANSGNGGATNGLSPAFAM